MSILFFCVSFATGIFLWRSTDHHILDPIRRIHGVIFESHDVAELDDLPQNELGQLGSRLSSQKLDLEQKNILLRTLTDEYQREAILLKVMSHDIATPLSVVRYSVDQLRNPQMDSDVRAKHGQRALANLMTIEEILSHVKDMKALESGKRTLVLKELTFGPIIKEIASTFKDRMESKGVTLEWMPSDEDSVLVADQISFRVSVASNLISNAIKFSDRGSRILVRCREIGGMTRFEVRDYGGGIPEKIRKHLFSTNHKGSEGESGTGFGMPLVKFYVDLYGGTIDFETRTKEESSTDHGTQFNIILKSKLPDSAQSAA